MTGQRPPQLKSSAGMLALVVILLADAGLVAWFLYRRSAPPSGAFREPGHLVVQPADQLPAGSGAGVLSGPSRPASAPAAGTFPSGSPLPIAGFSSSAERKAGAAPSAQARPGGSGPLSQAASIF